jgi:hypothetical protein
MMVGSLRKLNPLFNVSRVTDLDLRIDPKLRSSACLELQTLKFISEEAKDLIVGKPGSTRCVGV